MVQATCKKCSTTLSFDDDDVPPSGKVVKCSSCGAPVTVMPEAAAEMGLPISDLPAPPKRKSPLAAAKPVAPRPERGATTPLAGAPTGAGREPEAAPLDLADLPAPAGPDSISISDLPAPAEPGGSGAAAASPTVIDLPAPRSGGGEADLPAPVAGTGDADLPAPAAKGGLSDLPAPAAKRGLSDLPAPAAKGGPSDLPAPVAGTGDADLPAPAAKRGPSDLPAPAAKRGPSDLPAPSAKGGPPPDLPAPSATGGPSPDLPTPSAAGGTPPDLPAPRTRKQLPDLLTPKEPGPSELPDLMAPISGGRKSTGEGDLPDVLDLDDVGLEAPDSAPPPPLLLEDEPPAPANQSASRPEPKSSPPPGGDALSLDDLDFQGPAGDGPEPLELGGLELGGDSAQLNPEETHGGSGGAGGLDFDSIELGSGSGDAEPLELDSGGAGGTDFDGLELPDLAAGGDSPPGKTGGDKSGGVVSFSQPAKRSKKEAEARPARSQARRRPAAADSGNIELDLGPGDQLADAPAAEARSKRTMAGDSTEEQGAKKKAVNKRKRTIIAAAALGVVALGAGGFYGFTIWQENQARAETIEQNLADADEALAAGQWSAAARAATVAIDVDPEHHEAMALAAQARYAAVVEDGADPRRASRDANEWIDKLNSSAARGPEISKAQGLRLLVEGKPGQAIKPLSSAVKNQPKSANAFLFLGWAHAANGTHGEAESAFSKAVKRAPKRIAAHYGMARAQMAQGKRDEARKTLSAVIELDESHLGAQISLAELAELGRFGEREKRYLEILGRKDLGKADPREVSRVWALAGHEALQAGRIGQAQDRFAKALKLDGANLDAVVGDARAELAAGRTDNAISRVTKVLGLDPEHLDAKLTLAEAKLAAGDEDGALEISDGLLTREPPLEDPALLARAYLVRGRIFASDSSLHAQAEEDFKAAREASHDGDITPIVELSKLYNSTGRGDDAVALLAPVKQAADSDPELAVTLGVAYLGAGDGGQAETWFRRALELRADDIEARLQLGKALAMQQKFDEAIEVLKEAYQASKQREDIGVELAQLYASLGQQDKAYAQFEELLAKDEPSVNLRAVAGRFFARIGDTDRAAKMGEGILAEQPKNPAGLYLKGEALMAEKKFKEARELFNNASQNDPQSQFFEGLGRAYEGLGELNPALKAYEQAVEGDPTYLVPRLSRARIFVVQRRFGKALQELDDADKVAPKNADLSFYRGKTYVALKKYQDAVRALGRAVALDSRPAEPHYLLGVAHYNLNNPGAAARSLATATRRARGDESWLPEAYRVLGYASRAAGNRAGAAAAWQNYLDRVTGSNPEIDEVKRLLLRMQSR